MNKTFTPCHKRKDDAVKHRLIEDDVTKRDTIDGDKRCCQ